MNFDITKLDSLPAKAAGAKAKPKFGPAIRAVCRDSFCLRAFVAPALTATSGFYSLSHRPGFAAETKAASEAV